MTAPESASLAPYALSVFARLVLALMLIRLGWAAFRALRPSRRTPAASGTIVLASGIDQGDAACSSASKEGADERGPNWLVLVAAIGIAGGLLAGCSRPVAREPALDLTPTLAEFDRIDSGIWEHELTLCLAGLGRYR